MVRLHRRSKAPEAGYTLVEIIISMLIMAVLVSSVFSVALSTAGGDIKAERRVYATQGARSLSAALKGYVSGDPTTTVIRGPNSANLTNRWSINLPGVQTDSQGDAWALNPGVHTLTCVAAPPADSACFLPKNIRDLGGQLSYTVVAGMPSQVSISVTWDD